MAADEDERELTVANEVLVKQGSPVVWADTTDFNGAASGLTRTHQLDVTDLANAAARQGAKADLGAARAAAFAVIVGFEVAVVPTAGLTIEVYWAASPHATAATGNPAGTSGADAAWTGTTHGTVAQAKFDLILMGVLVLTPDDDTDNVQVAVVNPAFCPPTRHGMPVVVNLAGQALHSDAVEAFVALVPITDEVQ